MKIGTFHVNGLEMEVTRHLARSLGNFQVVLLQNTKIGDDAYINCCKLTENFKCYWNYSCGEQSTSSGTAILLRKNFIRDEQVESSVIIPGHVQMIRLVKHGISLLNIFQTNDCTNCSSEENTPMGQRLRKLQNDLTKSVGLIVGCDSDAPNLVSGLTTKGSDAQVVSSQNKSHLYWSPTLENFVSTMKFNADIFFACFLNGSWVMELSDRYVSLFEQDKNVSSIHSEYSSEDTGLFSNDEMEVNHENIHSISEGSTEADDTNTLTLNINTLKTGKRGILPGELQSTSWSECDSKDSAFSNNEIEVQHKRSVIQGSTKADDINVLTLNVKNVKTENIKLIPQKLVSENVDVILFQNTRHDCFDEKDFETFKTFITELNPSNPTTTVEHESFYWLINDGVKEADCGTAIAVRKDFLFSKTSSNNFARKIAVSVLKQGYLQKVIVDNIVFINVYLTRIIDDAAAILDRLDYELDQMRIEGGGYPLLIGGDWNITLRDDDRFNANKEQAREYHPKIRTQLNVLIAKFNLGDLWEVSEDGEQNKFTRRKGNIAWRNHRFYANKVVVQSLVNLRLLKVLKLNYRAVIVTLTKDNNYKQRLLLQ